MVIHSMLAKIDAGFDQEFMDIFLNNDLDKLTTQDSFVRTSFRQAFTQTTLQGYDCFVDEVQLAALDWEPLFENLVCPIIPIVGEHNPIYTPKILKLYFKDDPEIHVIPGTAHLLLYQKPKEILKLL